jgi:hypothetical protein
MPETTKKYHRVPSGKRKKKNSEIITISIGKGIKALYDSKNKVIVTYLFPIGKYTMKKAKEWVKKQKKNNANVLLVAENLALVKRLSLHYDSLKEQIIQALDKKL